MSLISPQSNAIDGLVGCKPDTIESRLRETIVKGRLAPGFKLPSERELAERARVGRHAVRQALLSLAKEGLIEFDGKRTRRVASLGSAISPSSSSSMAAGLLDQTVVVVSAADWRKRPHLNSGWDGYTQFEVLQLLEQSDFHVFSLQAGAVDAAAIQRLSDARPAGVLALDGFDQFPKVQSLLDRLRASGVPVVVHSHGARWADVDRAYGDQEAGGYRLARNLVQQQRRKRVLRLWQVHARMPWLDQRDRGIERALREAGLPVLDPVEIRTGGGDTLLGSGTEENIRMLMGYFYDHVRGPDAIDAVMLASDVYAADAAEALRRLGVDPENDVKIAGYDNIETDVNGHAVAPEIVATIDKNNAMLGWTLVDLLNKRIAGELPDTPQERLIEPRLVVGKPRPAVSPES
ncbi:MAG: GntR family transcriptional regulator [Planctomycetota bacterium]